MKLSHNSRDLTQGTVWKQLLLFFIPIAAGTCIQQLYNAVDGLIVGRFVGTTALAAVGGSAAQIINLLIGFFVALTTGASVLIAQIFGAGKADEVHTVSANALAFSLATGIFLALIGEALTPAMLHLLNTPEDTFDQSVTYLRIYFLGVPFVLLLNMESNMLRSVGDSVSPFVHMFIACISNIIMDFVFVYFFHWDVAGVAIATVLAQLINMILLSLKVFAHDGICKPVFKGFRPNRKYLMNMLKVGVPAGLQSSMFSVSNMIIQVGVNSLGTVVVASWAMTSKTDGIYWAVSGALGASITTFIGQNIGAGSMKRVKDCVKQGLITSLIITVLLSSAIMLFSKPVLKILTKDNAVIETTYELLTYFVPYYFTWTLIEVISGVLRGAGDAVRPVIIIGIGICLFRVVWLLTLFAVWRTLMVLSLSYVASWVVTGISLLIYYKKGKWMVRNSFVSYD